MVVFCFDRLGVKEVMFKAFEGKVSFANDNKTMQKRLEALREQLEARGETVDEDNSILIYSLAFVAVVLGASYYFTVLAR
ncbi:hypothetical protein DUNSADRAFT_6160 [Dunaliella salina]|uniref:Uncharacterized protein n=1 Tax=Dunaliella salina TaxID=3046 RepID=A0ABQ7GNW5_DUNSA|nr:hypothetical protein DUNSADRAFT_6160 [Dunaliella salina]|eukprot:KAF5836283.1 hypothetical protein DUNSADRAFT_6160 [Dunaliella salina]